MSPKCSVVQQIVFTGKCNTKLCWNSCYGCSSCRFLLNEQHEWNYFIVYLRAHGFSINLNNLNNTCSLFLITTDDINSDASALQPKLIATCQSSVELTKHLSTLLIEESHVSEEYARTREVHELTTRYDQLVSKARAREQCLRESRWVVLTIVMYVSMLVLA
jgi:hypothetical protein